MADLTEKLLEDVLVDELVRQGRERLRRLTEGEGATIIYGKTRTAKSEGDLYKKITGCRSKVLDV